MISKEDTNAKNEILRRIKWHKTKKNSLKNFIRTRRDEIVKERPPKEVESPMQRRLSKMLSMKTDDNANKTQGTDFSSLIKNKEMATIKT